MVATIAIIGLNGCAGSTPAMVSPPPQHAPVTTSAPGTYHHVQKGQTLWRIARIYNVELDEIASINHIPDTTSIEVGQQIFIPHRQKPVRTKIDYSAGDFIWPVNGRVISTFQEVSNNMVNKGLDIRPSSSTDVFAARSGKVVFYAEDFGGFGKTVIIDHGDGFSSVYARNSEVFIKSGDSVKKGRLIARSGSSGRDSGVYLHFEIRKAHIPQNPLFYLPRDN
ncbi:MAG: peptidoglycan DD-metalloendopeptidase family protein [Candidatus Omnitrophota bacterium]|nr:peptidoglycan DD-metalloendopeptidase family protein [Candidatus Omnitrophota bacterium]